MPLQTNLLFPRPPFNKSYKLSWGFMQFDSRSRGKFKCPFSIIYLSPVNTSYQHEAYMIGHTIPISFSSYHFYATFLFSSSISVFFRFKCFFCNSRCSRVIRKYVNIFFQKRNHRSLPNGVRRLFSKNLVSGENKRFVILTQIFHFLSFSN